MSDMTFTEATPSRAVSAPSVERSELPHTRIEPSKGWISLGLKDLWQYRELLFFLTWRDIKVRYKQTALGAAWAIIQPLFTMLVFTLFFGRLAKVPSDGIPYPLFSYTALLPWQLFAYALTESSNSVVANERLITKVYFPRLVVPLASILAGLVDFVIAFTLVVGMMVWYGVRPTWAVLTLPFFVIFTMATALGVGLWLSALNVQIPRCPLYFDFYRTVLVVCFAGRLLQHARSCALAALLRSQPHGWRHRRFPLGAIGQGASTRRNAVGLGDRRSSRPYRRTVLLSSHGEDLRGCGLTNPND